MKHTFTALFLSVLFSVFTAFSADYPAGQYDATLYSVTAGDDWLPAGQLTLKLGKTDKKNMAKGTLKVVYPGKKVSGKGVLNAASGIFTGTAGGEAVNINFFSDENYLEGSIGAYDVAGSRNLFLSKDKADVAYANTSIANWKGAVNAFTTEPIISIFSIDIGTKGKVKITGTTQNGTKISTTSQVQCGDEEIYIPIVWGKGKEKIAVEAFMDKNNAYVGFDGDAYGAKPDIPKGVDGAFFMEEASSDFGFIDSLLPLSWGLPLRVSNKLTIPKASKITIKNYTTDESENPCGLKLTLKPKDGTYKGSLYAHSLVKGKLKKTKLNVFGAFLGDEGYSIVTVPKKGFYLSTITTHLDCIDCIIEAPAE